MRMLMMTALLLLAACSSNKPVPPSSLGHQVSSIQITPATADIGSEEQYGEMRAALEQALPNALAGKGVAPAVTMQISLTQVDVDISAGTVMTGMLVTPIYTVKSNVTLVDVQTGQIVSQFPYLANATAKRASLFEKDSYSMSAIRAAKFSRLAANYANGISKALYQH